MASQPMPVAMGVPVEAVASPSPIATAVPLGEAVPVGMPVSTAAANAVAPTPMSMQAPASGFLRFPCSAETAVPLGEAVPVAIPVSTAAANAVAPTPMSMQASASGILRFPCTADKYEQLKAMTRADAPYALARRGMTRGQWAHCTDALEAVHDASFFKNCPDAEGCYWCVPLGPLQFLLCVINPISCVLCIQPVERAKRACVATCTPILRPLGYKVSVPDFALDDAIIFEPA